MNPNVLAKLAVRVVAIYYLSHGLVNFPTLLAIPDAAELVGGTETTVYLFALYTVLPLVVGILLWMAADSLSRLAVGEAKPDGNPATALQIQSVAISTAGLLVLFSAIPRFATNFYHIVIQGPRLSSSTVTENAAFGILLGSTLELILALALIVGAGFWPTLLWRIRSFGNRRESSNNALERPNED